MANDPVDEAATPAPRWWDSFIIPGTLLIGLGIFLWFVYKYLELLPIAQRFTIEGTRLVLVLTLIVSMLAFGGLMIARALYGKGDAEDLNSRYRLAREVFLVFAGTFGTVTGFYFGSAGTNASPVTPLSVKSSFADGKVVVAIEGGTAPFIGLLTATGQAAGTSISSADRAISFSVSDGTCPDKAKVTVVDGRGQQSETVLACDAPDVVDTGNAAMLDANDAMVTNSAN